MKRILVTGVGGPAGQSVSRLLLERGYSVTGVDARTVSVPDIRFFTVPSAGDPAFIRVLAEIADGEQAGLLIPTVTEELPLIADQWAGHSAIRAMIGPAPAVHDANDKYLTCLRLSEHGVAIPRFCLPSRVKSANDVEKTLGWPCLSKPRVGRGGRGVTVRQEQDWPAIAALDDGFILQQFLPGTDYGPNLFVSRRADVPPLAIVLEKTRLKEGIVGNAAEVRRADAPDVRDLACAAAHALGFFGPLDVDVRRGADGTPGVLEINARFGANISFVPEIMDAALAEWTAP